MQGKKHYTEKLFASFQLSERVPSDNFYRILKENLDLHYLYKSTAAYYGNEGQKSIDPVVFMKLILVGYFENLNSDRKIIEHARMRLDILYFIGYDIDEELPWHSTLSRTRQLYGAEIFRQLFRQVLKMCVEKGMVSGKRQAIDSAYIKANASMDSVMEKQILEECTAYTEALIAQDNDQLPRDKSKQQVSRQKKKEVEGHHAWKAEAYKDQPSNAGTKQVDEHGNLIRPKYLSNHTHYSSTDPDARISTKPGKPRQFTYSAQTSVDTHHHVITNILADYSDKRDSQSLPTAVEQTKTNLEENNLKLEEILADAGYSSGEALRYLKDNNITGYIPNFGQYKPEREGFRYNAQKDQYECIRPGGNQALLPYKRTGANSNGYIQKTYRSSEKDCKNCPLKTQCIGKSNFKKLDESIDKALYDEMHQRLQTPKAKRLKKLRSSTVEPVLGTLINFMGMRRIWTRGIAGATKLMLGAAIAYNLKKWLKYQPPIRKTTAMLAQLPEKAQESLKNTLFFIFLPQQHPHRLTS